MHRSIALVIMLSLAAACRQNEPSVSSPPPAPPGSSPGLDLGNLPPPAAGEVKGRIEVAPAVADKIEPGDAIYVIARNAATGTAVAVVRLAAPEKFPLPFTLSGSHTMQPGSGLFGKVRLQARVDKDGDAMSKNPGDVVGEVGDLVEVPASGVVLELDTVL